MSVTNYLRQYIEETQESEKEDLRVGDDFVANDFSQKYQKFFDD